VSAVKVKRIIPAVLWAALIFYLSSIPSLKSSFGIWDLYLRKTAHFTEYFILVLLVMPNFTRDKLSGRLQAVSIALLYAVSDEFHQSFVPGRTMSIYDMSIDWIGCFSGYLFYAYFFVSKRGGEELTDAQVRGSEA